MMHTKRNHRPRGGQSGTALIVALILMAVMTMLAVQGMRTNVMQERMAGNMRDRNVAFQAAEAALRWGEGQLSAGVVVQTNGPVSDPFDWDFTFVAGSGGVIAGFNPVLASDPVYRIEERIYFYDEEGFSLETSCPHVITAAGVGVQAETRVILQSVYSPNVLACAE